DMSSSASLLSSRPSPRPTLFPYTTLFRSKSSSEELPKLLDNANSTINTMSQGLTAIQPTVKNLGESLGALPNAANNSPKFFTVRSEEHTSELQSRFDLVCRLLLEKKKNTT